MSDYPPSNPSIHDITNVDINVSPSIQLDDLQKAQVGIVLDLFQAKGTMAKLKEWLTDDAVYEDLFATTKGREEVAGQFLGLPVVCQSTTTLSHQITHLHTPPTEVSSSSTHPIPTASYPKMYQIDMSIEHRFVFKPLGTQVDMKSTILIFANPKEEGGRIVRIQDRPTEKIPENSFINALRKMNAKVTPHILGVPQTEQEDQAKAEKFGAI